MADKSARPGKADFSIDDFLGEIEKAEDMAANKPLYAERMRNKRALDRADQKLAAEAAQAEEDARKALAVAEKKKTALEKRRTTKSNNDTATGMSARTNKTKINSVRPYRFRLRRNRAGRLRPQAQRAGNLPRRSSRSGGAGQAARSPRCLSQEEQGPQ
jgi:hypothetical protein